MWWDHALVWGGWLMMSIAVRGFWILLGVLVVALLRSGRPAAVPAPDADGILRQRFVRGEVDAEGRQARLDTLARAIR